MQKTLLTIVYSFLFSVLLLINTKCYAQDLYYLAITKGLDDEIDEEQMPYRIELKYERPDYILKNTYFVEEKVITDMTTISEIVDILKRCDYKKINEIQEFKHKYTHLTVSMYYEELTHISELNHKDLTTEYNVNRFLNLYLSTDKNYCVALTPRDGYFNKAEFDNTICELSKYFSKENIKSEFLYDLNKDSNQVKLNTDNTIPQANLNVKNDNINNELIKEVNQIENKINTADFPIMQEKQSQNELTIDSEANQDTNLINNDNNEYSINTDSNNFRKNILHYSMIGLILLLVILLIIIIKKHNKKYNLKGQNFENSK